MPLCKHTLAFLSFLGSSKMQYKGRMRLPIWNAATVWQWQALTRSQAMRVAWGLSVYMRADSCCPVHVACRLVLEQLTCCCQRHLTLKRGSSAPIHSTGQCVDCFGTTSCHHTSWPSLKLTFSRLAASTWSYTSTVLMVCPCASTFCTAVSTIPCNRSCHSVMACSRSNQATRHPGLQWS